MGAVPLWTVANDDVDVLGLVGVCALHGEGEGVARSGRRDELFGVAGLFHDDAADADQEVALLEARLRRGAFRLDTHDDEAVRAFVETEAPRQTLAKGDEGDADPRVGLCLVFRRGVLNGPATETEAGERMA